MVYVRSTVLDKYVLTAVAFGIIGIAMVIAGIFNLRAAPEQEEEPTKKRSRKNRAEKSGTKSGSNLMANWVFGGHRGMDLKKQGSLRIKIGVVFIVVALIIAGTYLL